MASRQVTCIITDNGDPTPGHITHIGGAWGTTARVDAVREIDSGTHDYYTRDAVGNRATVVTRKHWSTGQWYLTTAADSSQANNLLSLPRCG